MCILDVKKGDFNKCRTMIKRIVPYWEKLIEKKLRISGCSFKKGDNKSTTSNNSHGGGSNEEHPELPVWLHKSISEVEKEKREKETNRGGEK